MAVWTVWLTGVERVLPVAAEPAVFCLFKFVDDEVLVPAVFDHVVFGRDDEVFGFVDDAVFAVFLDDVEVVGHGDDVLVSSGPEEDLALLGDETVAFAGGIFAWIFWGF